MKKDRIPFLDELMDSCRLMPPVIGFILFWITIGLSVIVVPAIFEIPFVILITIEVIVILLLTQKYVVYRRVSKIENAIAIKIIWIHTKGDQKEQMLKLLLWSGLVFSAFGVWISWSSERLLIFHGLLCFIFSLKVLFYVPIMDLRVVEHDLECLQFNNGKDFETTELKISEITKISVTKTKIEVECESEVFHLNIEFASKMEQEGVVKFLKGLDLSPVNQI